MFKWLKKIFMTEKTIENESQEVNASEMANISNKLSQKPVVKPLVREFELIVYDVSLNDNDTSSFDENLFNENQKLPE